MQSARRRDTGCELRLRKLLHASGLRYRVDHPLPCDPRRRADILFRAARVAIFVDGCFWHGCPDHGTLPRANREWWRSKIAANRARDLDTLERLAAVGWIGLRVWEHEDANTVAARIVELVRVRSPRR